MNRRPTTSGYGLRNSGDAHRHSLTEGAPDAASDDLPPAARFTSLLDAALRDVDGQVMVSQSRCVDHLLDLLNATHNAVLRRLAICALDSIRSLHAVRAVDMHDVLSVLASAANVEFAAAGVAEPRPGCC